MKKKRYLLFVLMVCASFVHAQDKPNVVFILADDLGWGDLSCYGHPYAKTPFLDQLAQEGLRFERFYVTGVTCCPSRTGFMTSRHPASYPRYMAKYGFAGNTTVTQLFKRHGYTTGHFGKWHIGPDTKRNPVQQGTYGIDEIGVIGSNHSSEGGRDADLFSEAIQFIKKNRSNPFYVNIWGHITHYPVDPYTTLVENFNDVKVVRSDFGKHMQSKFDDCEKLGGDIEQSMRNYLGDVYGLDLQVGRLLHTLEELGLTDNTIVIFSSDQGPAPVIVAKHEAEGKWDIVGENTGVVPSHNMLGYAGGLRGGKHTQYEGGVRAPLIIRWPGHFPQNAVNSSSIVSGIDFLPTLCNLAGISIDPAQYEGENMADVWKGGSSQRSTSLFWRTSSGNANASMLDGQWKLHQKGRSYVLYNLAEDVEEFYDVAGDHPEIVSEMSSKLEQWVSELPDSYLK